MVWALSPLEDRVRKVGEEVTVQLVELCGPARVVVDDWIGVIIFFGVRNPCCLIGWRLR